MNPGSCEPVTGDLELGLPVPVAAGEEGVPDEEDGCDRVCVGVLALEVLRIPELPARVFVVCVRDSLGRVCVCGREPLGDTRADVVEAR